MAGGLRAGSVALPAGARSAGVFAGRAREGEIAGLQRARLLSAAVGLLAERGYGSFSAAALCVRAGVSRRTFYEIFEDREACLLAILQDTEALIAREIRRSFAEQAGWRERVRQGLWVVLCIAEANPALARACLVECQKAGGKVERERERILKRLIAFIDEGRSSSARSATVSALTAEALLGAALAIITARLTGAPRQEGSGRRAGSDLHQLLGELMSIIVLPYQGAGAARREMSRPLPRASLREGEDAIAAFEGPDPLSELPIRLTYRTAKVLQSVAQLTGQGAPASNRRVANQAGVNDPGQISKLLSRLKAHGLLENAAAGSHVRGEANQWRLTESGRRVVQSITTQAGPSPQRSAA